MDIDLKEHLVKNVLSFWLEHAIDEEYGGILTCLDKTGKVYGYEKASGFRVGHCILFHRHITVESRISNIWKQQERYMSSFRLRR